MKFFSAALLFVVLPFVVSATPFVARQAAGGGCPGSAPVQCCESMHSPHSHAGKTLLKQNGLESHPNAAYGMVAEGCNTDLGILDAPACSTTPVCCDTQPGELIAIGCLPIVL